MASVSQEYLGLIRSFPLRPINSEADLDRATAVMSVLAVAPKSEFPPREVVIELLKIAETRRSGRSSSSS